MNESRSIINGAPPYVRLWLVFFAYGAAVALLVQLFVLPIVLPHLHAGHGLLVGGDWVAFHELAAEIAARIQSEGWSAWQLRPDDQGPIGIASVFYALLVPEPYVLIPLNTALHATSALALTRILLFVVDDWRIAALGALPFLLYPSAAAWYSQIHKDGYFFAGVYLCLYAWLALLERRCWTRTASYFLLIVVAFVAGVILIWMVRIYGVRMMQGLGILIAAGGIVLLLLRKRHGNLNWKQVLVMSLLLVSIPIVMNPFAQSNYRQRVSELSYNLDSRRIAETEKSITPRWKRTLWLPEQVDYVLFALSTLRQGVLSNVGGKSNIDFDADLDDAVQFLIYLPRAVQVGFLAPFPIEWIGTGSTQAGTLMRRVAGAEMVGVYLGLIGLIAAVARWARRPAFWLILGSCTFMLTIYAYVMANVGTLYRLRYGFLMAVVGLGVAGIATAIVARRGATRNSGAR